MDSDLIDCPRDGIVVGADGITLDLDGHLVDGVPSTLFPGWSGVRAQGRSSVTVQNGVIREFTNNVHLRDTRFSTVRRIESLDAARVGILLDHASANLIEKSTVNGIGDSVGPTLGIAAGGGADDNVIQKNSITETFIALSVGSIAHRNRIVDNVVSGNGSGVVLSRESEDNLVARNEIVDNRFAGLVLSDFANRNLVEKNVITDHGDVGILLASDSQENHDNRASKNSMTRNHDGIWVSDRSFGTVIEQNVSNANRQDGIEVRNSTTMLAHNVANDNGDYGILAPFGAIDGGGNRASGNGNPAQCAGVSCR